ncbi:MAG: HAD family phosphatase [Ignavibacteria bacterium]|nr:HAD family phosphatase [Ignavibacteria bacterium]
MPDGEIKNIVFDLGNTLVYFDYSSFFEGVSRLENKLSPEKLMKYFTDNRLDIHLGTGKTNIRESFKSLKKKHGLSITFADFHDLYCNIFRENTEMKEFLENKLLDSGFKLFMLSNTDSSHINFINKNFPYVKHIKKRVLSYKVNSVKPDKRIYKYLITKMNISPEESIFIDDLKPNIAAAEEFGLKTIHYTSHKKFLREFRKLTGVS